MQQSQFVELMGSNAGICPLVYQHAADSAGYSEVGDLNVYWDHDKILVYEQSSWCTCRVVCITNWCFAEDAALQINMQSSSIEGIQVFERSTVKDFVFDGDSGKDFLAETHLLENL